MTTDPKDALPPRLNPTCTCICHTQPGVMHVAPCCREADPKDAEIARLVAELAESEAAAEGAFMILAQTQAERVKAQTDLRRIIMSLPTDKGERAAGAVEGVKMMRARLEAERDAALAQVAGAYEAAAQITENDKTLHEWEHTAAIRALTPAHALAALSRRDAQMRAEGMRRALDVVSENADWPEDEHGRTEHPALFARISHAILAAAEKEKI